MDCHGAYFPNHSHVHDVAYNPATDTSQPSQQGCATCHNDAGAGLATWSAILTEHFSDCNTCHGYADADGKGTPPLSTVQNTIATGTNVTCATCHTPKVPDVQHGVDHVGQGLVTMATACSGCHVDPANQFTNPNDPKVHNGCSTCHNASDNSLKGSAAGHGLNDAGFGNPNTCETCHGSFEAKHAGVDHSAAASLATDCSGCHTGTAGTTTGMPVSATDNMVHDACATCHGTTGALVGSAAGNTSPNSCNDCHGDFASKHAAVDHSTKASLSTSCSACHDGTQGTTTGMPVDAANNKVHDSCATCHGSTGALVSIAAGNTDPNECVTCHGGFGSGVHTAVDHSQAASLATDCSGCHTGTAGTTTGMPVSATDNMVHDACTTCHGTTGALVGSAAGNTSPNSCNDCHGDFASKHAGVDHSGAVSLSADCAACHDGTQGLASGMVVDPANDKVHDACATCHGSDGTLVGSAAGNTAPNECVDCHGAYFPNHSHVHDVRFDAALDLGQPSSTPCANCHNDNGGSLATWNDIYVEHLSSCDTCHAYTDADGQGTPPLSTVQNTIATGTAVHCLTCHTPKTAPAGHGGHPQPDVIAQKAAACTVCHDNDPSAPKAVVNDIHKGDCNNCHDASSGPPTLRNPVPPNAVAIVRGGDCVTCHGSGYTHDVFEAGTSHSKITFGDPALPGVDTSTCGACHSTRANGSADAEAIHMTDAKAGGRTWACEICHNNPEFNGLISDAINGTGVYASRPGGAVYCTDCHEYNDGVNPTLTPYAHVFPHGNRRHNIQGINNCVVCHSDLDVINGIHIPGAVSGSNSCDTCHGSTDPNVSATIAAGGGNCGDCHGEQYVHTYAGAPAHDITVNGASCAGCHTVGTFSEIVATHRDTCATCHGSSDPTVQNVIANANGGNVGCLDCHSGAGAAHHASAKAQAGLCETCHDNSQVGPTVANIRQLACVVCHVDANANGVAIVSLRLSKITGSEPTSLVNANATVGSTTTDGNGYLASHRINGSSPIAIYDFRACFDCHSGNNPNYPAAPVIAPFHGFPGDLSLEHIAYRDSSGKTVGTNRTIIGGGSVLVADENNNGDALPRVFMNEHPGHKHFRRFAANMRARSSKNGYSDNERLYDGNPYNNRNATNSALNTTVDVLFHKGGVTFANGFDPCQEAGKCGGNFGTDMVPLSGYDLTIATVPHTRFGTNLGTNFKNVPYMPNISVPTSSDTVVITQAIWTESTTTPGVGDLVIRATTSSRNNPNLVYAGTLGAVVGNHYEWIVTDVAYTASVTVTSSEGGSATVNVDNRTCPTCGDGGGDPAANHANYNAVPNATLNDGTPCSDCHVNGNLADFHYTKAVSCTWCHGSPVSGVDPYNLNLATVVCTDCHTVDPAVHPTDVMPDHSTFLLTTDSQCVSCHTGDVQSVVHAANGCSNCHDSSFNLKAGANGYGDATRHTLGGSSSCSVCHPNRAADFQNHLTPTHANVAGTASCQSCHTGDIPTVVHASCTSCHTDIVADGTLRAGTVGDASGHTKGTPSACADCHPSRAADFFNHTSPVDHVAKGHVTATTGATPTTNCAGCHNPADTINDSVAHNGQCADCHTPTTGVLRIGQSAPPFGDASFGAGDCMNCHGSYGYFEAHKHKDNHIVALDPSDLGQDTSQPCSDCHNDSGNSLASFADILVEHDTDGTKDGVGACVTCHDSTRNVNVDSAYTDIQDVIANGVAPIHCLTCHADKAAPNTHGGHTEGDGTFTWEPLCESCHGIGGNSNAAPQGEIIAGVHSNNCGFCHQGGVGGATLIGSAANATWGNLPHACTECHTTYFAGHSHVHDVAFDSGVDLAQDAPGTPCASCHDDAGAALGNWNAILTEHLGTCDTCHQYVDDGKGTPPQTTVESTILSGTGVTCTTCHTPKLTPNTHGGHGADFGKDAVCTTCHTGANVVVDIHHNDCSICHNGTPSRDTEKQGDPANGVDGDATLANGTAAAGTWSSVSCLTCHDPASYPRPAIHHDGVRAQAGLCDTCHTTSEVGPTVANIRQLACVVCHVDGNANGVAIVSLRLSKITGSEPTSLVNANATVGSTTTDGNGYLASHRINGSSPIAIYDFRACFDCHSGNNPNYPAAPVIAPFHGFPGDLSLEHIAYRDSSGKTVGTNRTIIGGGSVLVADENNNGDALPRVFMNEHPGHKHFRRFAANMRARSSKNGYSDNERLYDGNPYNNRNATNSALNTTVDVLFHKGGVTFANGFDPCQEAGKCGGNFGTDMVPLSGYDLTIATVPHTRFGTNLGTNFKNVPYMPNIPYPALPDDVTITLAEWDGSTLTVEATNTAPNETLSVWYDGNNLGDMTEVVEGSWTFSAPLASLPVPDVEVHTTSSLGVNATKTITDTSVPTPATAVDDNLSAAASGVTNLDVLANDSGTAISIISVTQPSLGSVAIAGGGSSIDYTGAGAGNTSFTYTIQGSTGGPSTATVNLTVTVNQPPAFGSASYTAPNATEGQAYSTTVAQDATDPEGDPITYSDNGAGTTCTWTSVAADGTISGTPGAGDVGSCVVRVKATATGGSDTADVNITVDPAPSGDTSYSNSGQTITLYSDAGYSNPIDVKNTVLSTGTTYYVEVTSTTVKDASNKNQLRVNDAYGNRPVDTTFKQTSTSSPYTYRQSFSVNAPGVYSIEAQVDDGNNTCKIAGLDFVVGGGEYIKTYSDSSYTTESTTFAVGQTVYVEAYSAAFTDGTPDAGQSKVDVGDFVNGKTNPNISVSKAGTKTYRMSFTMPAGYGSSGEYVGLKIRWKDSGGTTLGKPEMVVKIQ